jgi:putative inorganic carbon (hco3(-)) transporter
MPEAFEKRPGAGNELWWLIGGGVAAYLLAFFALSFLGFIYALPFLLVIPLIGYLAFQSILKPVILLIPMFGASYLGEVIHLIPEGAVPVTAFQLFLILTAAAFFFHMLVMNKQTLKPLGFELELLLILTLISFSLIYSPARDSATLFFIRFIVLIVMAYLIANILRERREFYFIFGLLAALAMLLGALSVRSALLDPVTTYFNYLYGGARIIGRGAITVEDPNVFATIFFLPIAFSTSIFLSGLKHWQRALAFSATVVLLAGLASTYSRSSWIATAVLLLLLVIYYKQYKIMLFSFLGIIVVIISVPELREISVNLYSRILDIFSGTQDDSSGIRLMLGFAGIKMFFDSYMLGVGIRGFPEYFTNYYSIQESIGVVEPHNVIYELLAELGLPGFLLFLLLVIIIFRKASANIRNSDNELDKIVATTLIASLTAFMIFYQFYGGALYSTLLWAIIGLIVAQSYILEQKRENTSPAV